MTKDCCQEQTHHPDLIRQACRAMPPEWELLDASNLLKVLADQTRMRLIAALLETELCVCDLSGLMAMSQSAISHQLRILRQSRLVRCRREGKNAFYSLDDRHVGEIVRTSLQHVREMYLPGSEPEVTGG